MLSEAACWDVFAGQLQEDAPKSPGALMGVHQSWELGKELLGVGLEAPQSALQKLVKTRPVQQVVMLHSRLM